MTIDISSVRLPDDAFWQSGVNRARDPLLRKFKLSHFGVLIDAPREAPITSRATLPLFAYYMGSYQQVATRDFPDDAILVAIDPDRNELRIASAVAKDGERLGRPVNTPAAQLPEGYLARIQEIDVRGRLQLPWESGRVISQILLLDLASNRAETKLTAGTGAFVDLEKENFLRAERARMDPPAPYPRLPLSAYAALPDSLPLPEGFGIALAAPRVAVLDGRQPVHLRGSWRLPVFPEELVKPANADYNKTHGLIQEDGVTPLAACVTIHLVAIGSGQGYAFHYKLQLPVSQLAAGSDTPTAAGRFNIDLTQAPGFPLSDQTVFVYAYAKEWASDAAPIGLVDRLPQE